MHIKSGHRGKEGTYRRVSDRFWWDGMYEAVKEHVKTCTGCQKRSGLQDEEALHPT